MGGEMSPSPRCAGLWALGVATSSGRYKPPCCAFLQVFLSLRRDLKAAPGAQLSLTGTQRVAQGGAGHEGKAGRHVLGQEALKYIGRRRRGDQRESGSWKGRKAWQRASVIWEISSK